MKLALVDANLLLLLVVGAADVQLVERHPRLSTFAVSDFDLLTGLLSRFSGCLACPNTWTEVSNLIGLRSDHGGRLAMSLRAVIGLFVENYVSSLEALDQPSFDRLGLTDSVLLTLAASGATLITADLPLSIEAARAGRNVVNFNHLRDGAYG